MGGSEVARGTHIQSLARAFDVIEVIANGEQRGAALTDITTSTGMNRTTVWRLVTNLRELGVVRSAGDGRFTLGPRFITLGAVARAQLLVSPEIPAILRRLRDRTGETCHLAGPEDNGMVYLDKVESTRPVRAASQIGAHLELYCTALGKTYLAFIEESVQETLLESATLTARTPRTLTDLAALRAELARIRTRGWAFDDEENEEEIRCVAAPIVDGTGRVLAAVSVSVPVPRLPLSEAPTLAREVVQAAADISRVFSIADPMTPRGTPGSATSDSTAGTRQSPPHEGGGRAC